MADTLAVMASSPADYERLGLSPTSIAPWEDKDDAIWELMDFGHARDH